MFRRLLAVVLPLFLAACQTSAPTPSGPAEAVRFPTEVYAAVPAEQGRVYRIDAAASTLHIHVFRGGRLISQGHNHVVSATAMEGALLLPSGRMDGARFDLVVPVDGLQVDPPALRASLGGAFGSEVSDDARAGTRANMLGPDLLDAAHYPAIGIHAVTVTGELPKLVITAAVTLRGVTRELVVPVDARVVNGALVAEGTLALRQSEFGIKPFSALGGLLRVQDELLVDFRLVARPD